VRCGPGGGSSGLSGHAAHAPDDPAPILLFARHDLGLDIGFSTSASPVWVPFHAGIALLWKALAHLATLGGFSACVIHADHHKTVPNCTGPMAEGHNRRSVRRSPWGEKYLFALMAADYAHYDKVYETTRAIISQCSGRTTRYNLFSAEIAAGRGHERPEEHPYNRTSTRSP